MISDVEEELARRAKAKRVREIKKALRELTITREAEENKLVTVWAESLAERTGPALDKGRAPPNFQPGSTAKVRSDLAEIVREANLIASKMEAGGHCVKSKSVLASAIERLSADTITALDRAIGTLWKVHDWRERVDLGYLRFELPNDLKAGRVSAATMRVVARLARAALSLEPEGRKTGSLPNLHAQAVAQGAAGAFIRLTGKRPPISNSRPGKGQVALSLLTDRLFTILDVHGDRGGKAPDPANYSAEAVTTYHPRPTKKSRS